MVAHTLAGQSLRPEWLFEVVNHVQGLVASAGGLASPGLPDEVLGVCPPESDFEQLLKQDLLARLKAEESVWSAVTLIIPSRPCVEASQATPESARLNAAVESARLILQSQPSAHWTVEALARRVGCNRTDLEVGFRSRYSFTVHTYLILCRVGAAKGLLRKTAWRVEEIGKAVGWRSKVSLYEHFQRVLQMTPDTYRRRWTPVVANDAVERLFSRAFAVSANAVDMGFGGDLWKGRSVRAIGFEDRSRLSKTQDFFVSPAQDSL